MDSSLDTWSTADELVELLRQRKAELGLSNAALDEICGFAGGVSDKYIGPSRTRGLTIDTVVLLFGGLGLRCRIEPDPDAAARVQRRLDRDGRRAENKAHTAGRINKQQLERARPVLALEILRTVVDRPAGEDAIYAVAGWIAGTGIVRRIRRPIERAERQKRQRAEARAEREAAAAEQNRRDLEARAARITAARHRVEVRRSPTPARPLETPGARRARLLVAAQLGAAAAHRKRAEKRAAERALEPAE